MTREEFNNNSYLVNNNALYNKHTEHISTTEPLYLDGMGGSDNIVHKKSIDDGGDTPTKTLWKLLDQGAYIFGEFEEGHLFIEGPGENLMYTADNQGRIATYDTWDPGAIPVIKSIFEPYFGEIESVTIKVLTGLNIGDDIPNWDAYEKISTLVYIKRQGPTIAGYIKDETGFIYTKNNNCYIFNLETGEVQLDSGPILNDVFKNSVIGWAGATGLNITQVEPKEENFEIGQVMQNWDEYVTI